MFVDVVESVRLIGQDEEGAVQRIRALLAGAVEELVVPYGGQVIEQRGDGLLLRFESARPAIACASGLHRLARRASIDLPPQARLQLRVGAHRSDVLADAHALFGLGVNLAARIAALGQPGDTLISSAVRDELNAELDGAIQDLGPCYLKHVDEPIRLFRHRDEAQTLPDTLEQAIAARMKLRPTLAVLPLQLEAAAPGGAADIGLGDVAADLLTRQFSRSPMLHVISALSTQATKGRELDLGSLYRRFRADYLLQGRLRAAGGSEGLHQPLALEVQLWRAGAGEPVWEERVNGTVLDLLSAQSPLLGRVVDGVGQRILAVEQRLAQATQALPNLASHTLYLNAVDLLHRFSLPEFERSRLLLQALNDRAPRHAEPLAWLARWHVFKVVQGWSEDTRRDGLQALSYSERALERDPQSALALTMAGSVHAGVKRDPEAAQRFYAEALQFNPSDSLAWLMSGVAQGFLCLREPALRASEMALGLAPMDPTRHFFDSLAATASLMAGDHERAIALAERSIRANASHGSSYRALAISQVMLGRHEQARHTIERLLAVEPHCTVQTYLARVAPANEQNLRFAEALREAGLPPA